LAIVIPALPFCHAKFRASKPNSVHYPREINTLGDHICARRLDLKLLQKQVAEQISVDETTITNWERNATVPAVRYIPAILEFLGHARSPLPSPSRNALPPRGGLGLSLRKMAEKLGVDPATLMGWGVSRSFAMLLTTPEVWRTLDRRPPGTRWSLCQGRSDRKPLWRSKREPAGGTIKQGFSGQKGFWSVAKEALLPRSAFGGGGFSGLEAGSVCGGFA
jgi:transcriptional regulator with XRE-family HTH domain